MFRFSGIEIDFRVYLEKSPKHISMIKICPKKRKRGDYAVIHFLLNGLPQNSLFLLNFSMQEILIQCVYGLFFFL
jgi:hypothetical protein